MRTRTSTLSAVVTCCCAVGAASAQTAIPQGERLVPAQVRITLADGTDTGWVDYQEALAAHLRGGGGACAATAELCFDGFQPDSDGITPLGGDTDCGLAGPDFRFFGVPVADSGMAALTADDFKVAPGFEGGQLTRITGAYYNYGDGNPANTTDLFLQIVFTEDEVTCQTNPLFGASLGAVSAIFTDVANNTGFYNTYDLDVCALVGVALPLPADGVGGMILVFTDFNSGQLAQAQPVIWGTAAGRPGQQSASPYWRDEDRSGSFTVGAFGGECGVPGTSCPEEPGTMIALFGVDGCFGLTCADTNCDNSVDLLDAAPFVQAVQDLSAYEAMFPGCDAFCAADASDDGLLNNFDMEPFIQALINGGCLPYSNGAPQTLRVFLAEEGLSNPADNNSPAVTPQLVNPGVETDGVSTERLYLWVKHGTTGSKVSGFGFNVSTTGSAVITDAVLYNTSYDLGTGIPWDANLLQPTDTSGDGTRWSGANALCGLDNGAVNGAIVELFDPHYDLATDSTLLGHIDVQGLGEVFLEIGDKGIATSVNGVAPGPNVNLGFGDEADGLRGEDYATSSSMADATLALPDPCAAFAALPCGDVNQDTVVNVADVIVHMGLAVDFPNSQDDVCLGDWNGDGLVNHFDTPVLFEYLFGMGPAPVCP